MNPAVEPLMLLPVAALGLIFGSFVTALSYRLPRGESIARGRSRCPACGHTLTAPDLVPVFSWAFQGGACRHCRAKISWRYPAIEAATCALFITALFLVSDLPHLLLLLAMTPMMMALAVIDLEHQRLPNALLVLLAGLAVGWRWVGDQDLSTGLITATVVVAAGISLDLVTRRFAGWGGLGMGDTKLFAIAGLALPVGLFLVFAALAGVLGIIFGTLWMRARGARQFPYGPATLAAYWLCLALADFMLNWIGIFRSG